MLVFYYHAGVSITELSFGGRAVWWVLELDISGRRFFSEISFGKISPKSRPWDGNSKINKLISEKLRIVNFTPVLTDWESLASARRTSSPNTRAKSAVFGAKTSKTLIFFDL